MMTKLRLTVNRGINTLRTLAAPFIRNDDTLVFLNDLDIGFGETRTLNNNKIRIAIGIDPLQTKFPDLYHLMDDEDFVTMGTAMYHELMHYRRMTVDKGPIEIQLSDLSKYNNPSYYRFNHEILPHEIEAEYSGVISMWDQLRKSYPKYADELMFNHLTRRTIETSYVFSYPENGFKSREQVEHLFEDAYKNSLTSERHLPSGFLKTDDEIAILISGSDIIPRREYAGLYNQLSVSCTDEKMASIVSYLHPELQRFYPDISFYEIRPEHILNCHMPEISDDAKLSEDAFTRAVMELSNGSGMTL